LTDFKVTTLFDADYLRNATRDSYNGILIGTYPTYTCRIRGCHFEWPCDLQWLSKIFSDKKHRAVCELVAQ